MTTNPYLRDAIKLAPIVERVHGANHPELSRVRELTEALAATKDASLTPPLYAELREVTKNYLVPADACEGFTAAYRALQQADAAAHAA